MDVESHEAHKIKIDNLVTSASFKNITSKDKTFPPKGLRKVRSFHREEKDSYTLNEIIKKKDTNDIQFKIQSPISKNIDQTSEMENENMQNISNLIETDGLKQNSEEMTNNITSFDNEKDKEKPTDLINKVDEKENIIQFMDNREENETDISLKKVPLVNYMQVLYDQNSERLRKRSQQMKKMKEKLNIVNESDNLNKEENTRHNSENKSKKVPITTKVFLEKEENIKESILEQAINSHAKEIKNDDTELVISDLDCPIEEDTNPKPEANNKHVKNSLSLNLPTKSFIQITNNLLIKSHAKQDNVTSDYLLALNQCETQEEESDKKDNKSENGNDKHKRLPSNYVVNDVIEEENSDNCTDSEFSYRKKSLIFNKLKSSHSTSDKKDSIVKTLNNNIINNAINLNVIYFSKLDGRNSKSEVPSNYSKKQKSYNEVNDILKANHKISKSEMFNIQVDLKKILDQLEKKKKIEVENSKIKVTNKKKLILDKFFKSNSHHDFTSNLEEEKINMNINLNMKKISLYTPKNSSKNSVENLTFKKQSPAVISREICYNENENNEINNNDSEMVKKNEINTIFDISGPNKEKIIDLTVDNFEDCFANMLTPKMIQKSSSKNEIVEPSTKKSCFNKRFPDNDLTNISKKLYSTKIKDTTYQHHRKKSSFFNSEDLRISKQENFKICDDKLINKNLFNIFAINTNKSSNLIELENDKNYNFNNNDNSIVKICDSKLEISQNNINHDTIPSNLTSMISFMNNNSTYQPTHNNVNFQNTMTKLQNVDMNTFDFDFKDSPMPIKYAQEPSLLNYFCCDTKSKNNQMNLNLTQAKSDTKNDTSMNKKTKSFDLYSVSNQVNINIIYNSKKTEDKTRNSLVPNNLKQKNNSKDMTSIPKNLTKTNTNSSTHNLRKKSHYKTPSMNLNYHLNINTHFHHSSNNSIGILTANLPSNTSNMRSNSFSKNPIKTSLITSTEDKLFKQAAKLLGKKSDGNTPKQLKKNTKSDLKQYLTFSGSKHLDSIPINQNLKANYSTANNEKCNSYRINSESSIQNIMNTNSTSSSNKKLIIEAMKSLKFQSSSLDHQKYSLEKLNKSKANLFSLLINYESSNKSYEFKGLYEINEEKNNLCKIYSTNFYPSSLEISEIKDFFNFDTENIFFRKITNEVKKFNPDTHAFSLIVNKPKKI